MPGGDRTGPMGMGPMTGRRAGYCAGFGVPGFANRGFGASFGRGRGGGRGWRNMFYATGLPGWARFGTGMGPAAAAAAAPGEPLAAAAQQQIDALKQQAQDLAGILEQIRERISQLEGKTEP